MTTPEPFDQSDRPDRVEHRLERTYEVTATPEQVWDAIATAEGISAWMVPTQLDPQVGGAVAFDLGGLTLTGVVTGCEPNRRFAYEEPWPIADQGKGHPPEMVAWAASLGASLDDVQRDLAAATPIATEFLVEAVSGGSCVVRVVTSAYGNGSEWEREFFAQMAKDLVPYLDNLAAHLDRAVASERGSVR